ncbi:hypothetical protein [uncultured Sphingomonas sp.]|uniref:hypothetical protein n=1 Tax=uncultured Sphingomonas sp. TaxID=158754 RepID=UPI0035CA96FE
MPSVMLYQVPEPVEAPVPPPVAPPPPVQVERLRELEERIAPMHVLKRTGQRSFAFNGQILGTVCGIDQVLPYWYEINVYRTVLGTYISDIRLFGKGAEATDLFRVTEHDAMDAVQNYLEHYDPSCDLPPVRYDATSQSAAALTLRAIEVRAELQRIADHYHVTVGALLTALPD